MILIDDYIPAPSPKNCKNSPNRLKIRTDQIEDNKLIKHIKLSEYSHSDEDIENKENQPCNPNVISKGISSMKYHGKYQSDAEGNDAHGGKKIYTNDMKITIVNDEAIDSEFNEQRAQSYANKNENEDVPYKVRKEVPNNQTEISSEINPVSSPNTIISKLKSGHRLKDGMILMLSGQVDKRKTLLLGAQVCSTYPSTSEYIISLSFGVKGRRKQNN